MPIDLHVPQREIIEFEDWNGRDGTEGTGLLSSRTCSTGIGNQSNEDMFMAAVQSANELKEILKGALVEVLQERGDLISNAVEEALEDIHLARGMDAAKGSGLADREAVAKLLGVTL